MHTKEQEQCLNVSTCLSCTVTILDTMGCCESDLDANHVLPGESRSWRSIKQSPATRVDFIKYFQLQQGKLLSLGLLRNGLSVITKHHPSLL